MAKPAGHLLRLARFHPIVGRIINAYELLDALGVIDVIIRHLLSTKVGDCGGGGLGPFLGGTAAALCTPTLTNVNGTTGTRGINSSGTYHMHRRLAKSPVNPHPIWDYTAGERWNSTTAFNPNWLPHLYGPKWGPMPSDYYSPDRDWSGVPSWRTPALDPIGTPIGQPSPVPAPIPYPMIPHMPDIMPDRAPTERPVRGPRPVTRPRPSGRPSVRPRPRPGVGPGRPPPAPPSYEPDIPGSIINLPPEPPSMPPRIEITPDGPVTLPGKHRSRPPNRKKEKELKVNLALPPGALSRFINRLTEFDDMVRALYKALPKECRLAARKKAWARTRTERIMRAQEDEYGPLRLAPRSERNPNLRQPGGVFAGGITGVGKQPSGRQNIKKGEGRSRFTRYDRIGALISCGENINIADAMAYLFQEWVGDIVAGAIGKIRGGAKGFDRVGESYLNDLILREIYGDDAMIPKPGGQIIDLPYRIIYG